MIWSCSLFDLDGDQAVVLTQSKSTGVCLKKFALELYSYNIRFASKLGNFFCLWEAHLRRLA